MSEKGRILTNKKLLLMLSTFMSFQSGVKKAGIKIREPVEIEFGSTENATDKTLFRMYLTNAFYDAGNIETTSAHYLVSMLETLQDALDEIFGKTATYANATTTAAQLMMNIGRLARQNIEDDQFLDMAVTNTLEVEYGRLADGTAGTTTTKAIPFEQLWYTIGRGQEELYGNWYTTHYTFEDDALAGCWLTLNHIAKLFGWQIATYLRLVFGVCDFTFSNGYAQGRIKHFNQYNMSTWSAALLSEFNSAGLDVFGLVKEMATDDTYRGIKVLLPDGLQEQVNKLFSSSKWIWRYKRWLEVIPLYSIWSKVDDYTSIDRVDHHNGTTEGIQLFRNYTNTKWKWFNDLLLDCYQRMSSFYYRGSNGKSFAAMKSKFKVVDFFEYPTPSDNGTGGLLLHQNMYYDYDAVTQDEVSDKFTEVESVTYSNQVRLLRDTTTNAVFQVIGDIPMEDQILYHALNCNYGTARGGSPTALGWVQLLEPVSFNGFFIERSEDEGERLLNTLIDGCATSTLTTSMAVVANEGWLDSTSHPTDYAVGSDYDISLYYQGRGKDPYKKLKHICYDTNNLDVSKFRKIMGDFMLGSGKSSDDMIPVSAYPEKDKEEPVDEEGQEVSAMTKDDLPSDDIQPVSATPATAKELKKAEQDVKKAKDKAKKEEKQEKAKKDKKGK